MTYENYMKFKLQFINKVLLEHRTFICLHITCGCFCPAVAKLSSCDRDRMACKTENIFWPFTESLLSPGLCVWEREAVGVSVVMSGVLGLLWSCVVNRSAKIWNLVLKSGLAIDFVVIETAIPIIFSQELQEGEDVEVQRIKQSFWIS